MADRTLTRRQVLKTGLGLMAGAALPQVFPDRAGAQGPGLPRPRPNIVYIISDQLRACSLGCYGNEEISTPHIDKLAAQAARFGRAVATSPLCAPHRSCLMTGRYPTQTGVFSNTRKLAPEEISIAEVLQPFGYRTGYIGKWHLDGQALNPPDPGWVAPCDRQGFRSWTAYNCAHVYYNSLYYQDLDPVPRQIPVGVYEPDWQTDRALEWITQHAGHPFSLVLSIGTPHPPGMGSDLPPGGDYQFPYDPDALTLRPNVDYPNPAYARAEYADYYGIISNLDWNVGRILARLSALGLDEDTIVVFSSDHGDLVGSHYNEVGRFRGKSEIYSESLDVPFLLRWTGHIDPMVVPDVFGSVDIMPTLLGLCRVPAPNLVMGRDFSPVLRGFAPPIQPPWGPVPSTESVLVGMFAAGAWVGVRTATYTFACGGRSYQPRKLYDNDNDPYQLVNLVDDPGYAPIRNALYAETVAWLDYAGWPWV